MYAYLPNLYASVYVWVGVWVVSVFHSSRVFFLGPISECFFVCFRRGKSSSSSVLNQIREMGVQKKKRAVCWLSFMECCHWHFNDATTLEKPHIRVPPSISHRIDCQNQFVVEFSQGCHTIVVGYPFSFVGWLMWCACVMNRCKITCRCQVAPNSRVSTLIVV